MVECVTFYEIINFTYTFYYVLKNLVLWAKSEIFGSALEFCV